MPARGQYTWREKKEKKNPRTRVETRQQHDRNEPIHPPTTLYYSSTAFTVRIKNVGVTSTKRSTHPPSDTLNHASPATRRRTNLPTHDVLQQCNRADALIETGFSCCDTGIYMFLRCSATPGSEQTHPREGISPRSPLAEWDTAPVMRRGQRRASVWVGRGATARQREAEWSSGVAAVSREYYKYFQRSIWISLSLPRSIIKKG